MPSGTLPLITSVGQNRQILPIRERVLPNYSFLKVRRTLMSIARDDAVSLKVRRTLMFPAAMRLLQIKDLKDLRAFLSAVTIDMQDLKDLKRFFHVNDRGGQAPALR